jgi:pseudomonalisin
MQNARSSVSFRGPLILLIVAFMICTTLNLFAQNWTPTATQAIGPILVNAISQGNLPDSTPIHVNLGLQIQDKTAVEAFVQHITTPGDPLFQQELEPADFIAKYSPSNAQVQSVVDYLTGAGFSNVQAEPNNLMVSADGTAAAVRTAFNTQLGAFLVNGKSVYANLRAAQVPDSLSGLVVAVLGLNNAAIMTIPKAKTAAVSVPVYPGAYRPKDLWTAYDVGTTATGSKTAIAIFAEGDVTGVVSDLRLAETNNNLPRVPVKIVQVGLASPDTSGADEFAMDTQYSTGMADTVSTLYIYTTTSLSDSDVALMFNHFAAQKLARAGSASFGLCEAFAYADGSMLVDDEVFLEAAAQGQTVFASSGDNGSSCGVAVGVNGVPGLGAPMVEYPAASPYVIGAGGTTLLTNSDGTWNDEIAWNAGGGGVSQFELSPYWQSPVNVASTVGRGVPDVAMDADPNSGVYIWLNGTEQCCYGGTSLSSPLSLGVWARFQSGHLNSLGYAGPVFYKGSTPLPSPASPAGFHDITVGANGLYFALPGYDLTTGLGSFDVSAFNAALPPPPKGRTCRKP